MNTTQSKNSGLIPGFRSTDFVGGTIPYEVRNPSGDWTPFLVRGEKQSYNYVDVMGCVSFSANNCCEIQIKQQTGIEVNLSDRFLAKESGTTKSGNWMYIVGDVLRKIGCPLEEEWPIPPQPFDWDSYYVGIPQNVVDKAKSQFLDKYDVAYERLGLIGTDLTVADLHYHLKHAPLWVTIPGHAITGVIVSADDKNFTYFDSYDPFLKTLPISQIDSVWKLVLTVKGVHMEVLQVSGEQTLVVKNGGGKYFDIATTPDLFPLVKRILGIPDGVALGSVTRAEINSNYAGQAKPVLAFVEK